MSYPKKEIRLFGFVEFALKIAHLFAVSGGIAHTEFLRFRIFFREFLLDLSGDTGSACATLLLTAHAELTARTLPLGTLTAAESTLALRTLPPHCGTLTALTGLTAAESAESLAGLTAAESAESLTGLTCGTLTALTHALALTLRTLTHALALTLRTLAAGANALRTGRKVAGDAARNGTAALKVCTGRSLRGESSCEQERSCEDRAGDHSRMYITIHKNSIMLGVNKGRGTIDFRQSHCSFLNGKNNECCFA